MSTLWGRVLLGKPGEQAGEILGPLQEVEVAAVEVDDLSEGTTIVRYNVVLSWGKHRMVLRVSDVHLGHSAVVFLGVCDRLSQQERGGPQKFGSQHSDLGIQAVVKGLGQRGGRVIERRGRVLRPVFVVICNKAVIQLHAPHRRCQMIYHGDPFTNPITETVILSLHGNSVEY